MVVHSSVGTNVIVSDYSIDAAQRSAKVQLQLAVVPPEIATEVV